MASGQPIVSEAAVLDAPPDSDEWGRVVRVAGPVEVVIGEDLRQRRFDITDPVIYVGFAVRGAADADPVWTIKRIQFTSGNPTTLQWATDVAWTARAIVPYT